MREIEVKARVKNKAVLLEKARTMGIVFGDVVTQDDTTFETDAPYDNPNWNIFRIRKQAGKTILTMKYKASTRSRDNHERESVIDDAAEITDMLERLGYKQGVNIRKSRQTAKYKDFELCLDEVEGLGSFIEVEKLARDDADVDAIQSTLWELLRTLGVEEADRVHKGYDTLMHEHLKSQK